MNTGITIIGILASIGTGLSLLPQLIKILKEKKAQDISYFMLGILFVGLGLWTVYGFLKQDWIITISNFFSFVVNCLLLILNIYFTKKK